MSESFAIYTQNLEDVSPLRKDDQDMKRQQYHKPVVHCGYAFHASSSNINAFFGTRLTSQLGSLLQ
jgi:hypothetical protein